MYYGGAYGPGYGYGYGGGCGCGCGNRINPFMAIVLFILLVIIIWGTGIFC